MTIQFETIELYYKETEELIKKEHAPFMQTSISYLSDHMEQFLYVETEDFTKRRIETFVMEKDDVFQTYGILCSFPAKKLMVEYVTNYLKSHSESSHAPFSVIHDAKDGLLDMNIPLSIFEQQSDQITFYEAIQSFLQFFDTMMNDNTNE